MTKRCAAFALALVFAGTCVSPGLAQRRGGGSRAGGARAGASRPPSSAPRPAPPPNRGGFDFSRDTVSRPNPPPARPPGAPPPARPPGAPPPGAARPPGAPPPGAARPPGAPPPGAARPPGAPPPRPPGPLPPPIPPIRPPMPAWGWNGYVPWYPAPGYWGGGFWGPFWGGVATAVVFGEIVDETTHEEYTSYQVQQDSAGAKVLAAYGLTQTQCGAANLVVIFGPNNSVVCALPNERVAAGNYSLDVTNLTIVSYPTQ